LAADDRGAGGGLQRHPEGDALAEAEEAYLTARPAADSVSAGEWDLRALLILLVVDIFIVAPTVVSTRRPRISSAASWSVGAPAYAATPSARSSHERASWRDA